GNETHGRGRWALRSALGEPLHSALGEPLRSALGGPRARVWVRLCTRVWLGPGSRERNKDGRKEGARRAGQEPRAASGRLIRIHIFGSNPPVSGFQLQKWIRIGEGGSATRRARPLDRIRHDRVTVVKVVVIEAGVHKIAKVLYVGPRLRGKTSTRHAVKV